ncbi:hypothetical protein [Dyella subtropica]|uniref:T4 family baseplate hub assembly chaperone n=1 Tax=Dyella subtropica TaxID=2992127 RepID=UPI00225B95D7|nr:hypothetical protein [Dyella subtropica]
MQALSGERLLAAWDRAHDTHVLLRAVDLLGEVLPGVEREQLLQLPLGELNRLLLQLRQSSFGPVLEGYADCRRCGTAMEFSLPVASALAALDAQAAPDHLEWQQEGQHLRMRQATAADLLACAQTTDVDAAEERLLARCIEVDGATIEPSELAGNAMVRQRFDHLHAGAELRCALSCPQCKHEDNWEFDIAHFVWLEARNAAQRLLADIHALACHYGWSEHAIASMSPHRRNAYLELLSA